MIVMKNAKTSGYQGSTGSSLRALALRNEFDTIKSNNTYVSFETLQDRVQQPSDNSTIQKNTSLSFTEIADKLRSRAFESTTGDLNFEERLNDEVSTVIGIENLIYDVPLTSKNDIRYTVDKESLSINMNTDENIDVLITFLKNEVEDSTVASPKVVSEQFRGENSNDLIDVLRKNYNDIVIANPEKPSVTLTLSLQSR